MRNKRILLMHISNISGHFRATYVIECALRLLDPKAEILSINCFSYTSPKTEKVVNAIYMGIIKKIPLIWKLLYDNPRVVSLTNRLKAIPHYIHAKKIMQLYQQFKPDVVICTQAYPCGMVADFKQIYNIDIPLIGVLTDYMPHSFWIYPNVDYYIAASDDARERLIQKGVQSDRIKCLGIPIDPKFKESPNQEVLCERLKLNPSIPVILIMGGGQGLGPIKKIVCLLDRLNISVQIIVVCGTNIKLFNWLKNYKDKFHKTLLCFGYVENIDELMQITSIVITKPGGLTTAEATAKGLAMVIVKPIPGQEENNTDFLLKNNAAVRVNRLKELRPLIESLLVDKNRLNSMRQSASKLSWPNSSIDIARLALTLCKDES